MATSAQPSVYISYAPQNHEWYNRVAKFLANAGFNIVVSPPTPRPDVAELTREKAQVFVLLVSSQYLGSNEILKKELPHVRSLSQTRNRRAIAIILEPCPWQSFMGLHEFIIIPEDSGTLAGGAPSNRRRFSTCSHEKSAASMSRSQLSPNPPRLPGYWQPGS